MPLGDTQYRARANQAAISLYLFDDTPLHSFGWTLKISFEGAYEIQNAFDNRRLFCDIKSGETMTRLR